MYPVARDYRGRLTREIAAAYPRVKTHGNTFIFARFLQDKLTQGLRRVPDDVLVHPEQADAGDSAQARGSELQSAEKPAFDFLLIPGDPAQLVFFKL
jgi:hypothetical protein